MYIQVVCIFVYLCILCNVMNFFFMYPFTARQKNKYTSAIGTIPIFLDIYISICLFVCLIPVIFIFRIERTSSQFHVMEIDIIFNLRIAGRCTELTLSAVHLVFRNTLEATLVFSLFFSSIVFVLGIIVLAIPEKALFGEMS